MIVSYGKRWINALYMLLFIKILQNSISKRKGHLSIHLRYDKIVEKCAFGKPIAVILFISKENGYLIIGEKCPSATHFFVNCL